MTQFTAHGPFKIPIARLPGGKEIGAEQIAKFWEQNPDFEDACGVYVFAMRSGPGVTPMYVGKATRSFGREAFADHKRVKYGRGLREYKKGTPVMFFVTYPAKKGKVNGRHIAALEKYLIRQGAEVNPRLLNITHTKPVAWGIRGVLRSDTKSPTNEARGFARAFGLRS